MGTFKPLGHIIKSELSPRGDVTMTRFVKSHTFRSRKQRQHASRQLDLIDVRKDDSAKLRERSWVREGRSKFHAKGVKPVDQQPRLLASGHSNVKIGKSVRIGKLKGYHIFTLSFEERATCPSSCNFWNTCYGNNMPYARRIDHRDLDAITTTLEAEIAAELGRRGRKGMLIRLHALGDFFSVAYVRFWQRMLVKHDRLSIYGYTARKPDSAIGREIAILKKIHGLRFAIRWSDHGGPDDCTVGVSPGVDKVPGAFICPEQLDLENGKGEPLLCANCGLCWTTKKNVAFLEH
jgi:hypothetical protein